MSQILRLFTNSTKPGAFVRFALEAYYLWQTDLSDKVLTIGVDPKAPPWLKDVIIAAVQQWQAAMKNRLQFSYGGNSGAICVGWDVTGTVVPSYELANTTIYTNDGKTISYALITFNPQWKWHANEPWGCQGAPPTGVSAMSVALHEVGHAVGLDDQNNPASIENFVQTAFGTLQPDDLAGTAKIAASYPPIPAPPPVPPKPKPPQPQPAKGILGRIA